MGGFSPFAPQAPPPPAPQPQGSAGMAGGGMGWLMQLIQQNPQLLAHLQGRPPQGPPQGPGGFTPPNLRPGGSPTPAGREP